MFELLFIVEDPLPPEHPVKTEIIYKNETIFVKFFKIIYKYIGKKAKKKIEF